MEEKTIEINLAPLAIVVGSIVLICNLINNSTKIDIEKEKTKQLELQLQIEQQNTIEQ